MRELQGARIEKVEKATEEEVKKNFSHVDNLINPHKIVLKNGSKIYPSRDASGNGPGAMYVNGELMGLLEGEDSNFEGYYIHEIHKIINHGKEVPRLELRHSTEKRKYVDFYADPERNHGGVIFGEGPDGQGWLISPD